MLTPQEARNRRGAYSRDDGLRRSVDSVVAVVDVLGFTQQLRAAAARDELDSLLDRIGDFMTTWSNVFVDRYGVPSDNQRSWEVKFFTDNVILAHPMRPQSDSEMGSIISNLSMFQIGGVAEEGFFVRGGVAVGGLYMDETVVFGLPLLDAHTTEACVANVPRIVFSDSARTFLAGRIPSRSEDVRDSAYWRDVVQDEDGQLFLNYLEACFNDYTEPPEFNWINRHRDRTLENIERFSANAHIRAKYEWVARYHNYWCSSWRITEYCVPGYPPLDVKRLDELDLGLA